MPRREHKITVVAEVGDRVRVENYRRRPARWEHGEVISVDANIHKKRVHVTYTVMLDRRTDNGPLRLYVSGDAIEEARDAD